MDSNHRPSSFEFEVLCADSYNFRHIVDFLRPIVAKNYNKKLNNLYHLISLMITVKKY